MMNHKGQFRFVVVALLASAITRGGELENRKREFEQCIDKCHHHLDAGDLAAAKESLSRARAIHEQPPKGDAPWRARCLLMLTRSYSRINDPKQAIEFGQQYLRHVEPHGSTHATSELVAQVTAIVAKHLIDSKRFAEANTLLANVGEFDDSVSTSELFLAVQKMRLTARSRRGDVEPVWNRVRRELDAALIDKSSAAPSADFLPILIDLSQVRPIESCRWLKALAGHELKLGDLRRAAATYGGLGAIQHQRKELDSAWINYGLAVQAAHPREVCLSEGFAAVRLLDTALEYLQSHDLTEPTRQRLNQSTKRCAATLERMQPRPRSRNDRFDQLRPALQQRLVLAYKALGDVDQAISVAEAMLEPRPSIMDANAIQLRTWIWAVLVDLYATDRARTESGKKLLAAELEKLKSQTSIPPRLLAARTHYLGILELITDNPETAGDYLADAIVIYQRLVPPDLCSLAKAHNDLGTSWARRDVFQKAIDQYQQAAELLCQLLESPPKPEAPDGITLESPASSPDATIMIAGVPSSRLGESSDDFRYHETAELMLAEVYLNLVQTFQSQGGGLELEPKQMKVLEEFASRPTDSKEIARLQVRLFQLKADLFLRQERPDEARESMEQVRKIANQTDFDFLKPQMETARRRLAMIAFQKDVLRSRTPGGSDFHDSQRQWLELLETDRASSHDLYQIRDHTYLGLIAHHRERYEDARRQFAEAIASLRNYRNGTGCDAPPIIRFNALAGKAKSLLMLADSLSRTVESSEARANAVSTSSNGRPTPPRDPATRESRGEEHTFARASEDSGVRLNDDARAREYRQEAAELLKQAIEAIDVPRDSTVGGEGERIDYFAQFEPAIQLLMDCQLTLGQPEQAILAAERARDRVYLERLLGADSLHRIPPGKLRRNLKDEESRLEREWVKAVKDLSSPNSDENTKAQSNARISVLQSERVELRQKVFDFHARDKQMPTTDIPSIDEIRRELLGENGAMLYYILGGERAHVILMNAPSELLIARELVISVEQADVLNQSSWPLGDGGPEPVAPGALTSELALRLVNQYLEILRDQVRSQRALRGFERIPHPGSLPPTDVTHNDRAEVSQVARFLATVSDILLPPEIRRQIRQRERDHLIIVPDGALHRLPFEALVDDPTETGRLFVLDTFPPIAYAPSITVMRTLNRRQDKHDSRRFELLSMGDFDYEAPSSSSREASTRSGIHRSVISANSDLAKALSGRLPRLKYTAEEIAAASKPFRLRARHYQLGEATEKQFRRRLEDFPMLHIAGHAYASNQYDSAFNFLALTGPSSHEVAASNDGLLFLYEIEDLPLAGCELVVLSACETNLGTTWPLESDNSLTRAFLIAGCKRVISSQWKVADQSTAQLIADFFKKIADDPQREDTLLFARALQSAKRELRGNPEFASPYHWAPFVLIGPGGFSRD